MNRTLPLVIALLASPALADETRQLDAHEHGVGALDIAVDGAAVAMEFRAPGADIVGFEYVAETAEDRAAIDAAVATLARPLDLFVVPADAECTVTQASAALEGEEREGGDGHDDHAHDEPTHDDHADEGHAHDDDTHESHAEDEHAHDDHAEDASHTEFHASYRLTCGDPAAISKIDFAYFDTFGNAREVEVQVVSGTGAQAFEVTRDAPVLDLRGMF